jgi:hypothetical protein
VAARSWTTALAPIERDVLGLAYSRAMLRLIATYCSQGPFRHVRTLLERPSSWFPWGYRSERVQQGLRVQRGQLIELWEVDDTRRPTDATPIAVAEVDYVTHAEGYLALTLHRRDGLAPRVPRSQVLECAERQLFLAEGCETPATEGHRVGAV